MNLSTITRIAAMLMALLVLSGCASTSRKKSLATQTGGESRKAQPVFVGTVTLVNEELRFVLIEASPLYMPGAGQALKCLNNGTETAIIAVGAERKRPFISADIVKGTPSRGDEVYQ